jgi:hypothetical protein
MVLETQEITVKGTKVWELLDAVGTWPWYVLGCSFDAAYGLGEGSVMEASAICSWLSQTISQTGISAVFTPLPRKLFEMMKSSLEKVFGFKGQIPHFSQPWKVSLIVTILLLQLLLLSWECS